MALEPQILKGKTMDHIINVLVEQALLPILSMVITLIVGWAAYQLQRWTGISIEARHREALQSALENGALYAVNLLLNKGQKVTLERAAEIAAGYVRQSVPDALQYFQIGSVTLRDLLIPKVPLVELSEEEARALTGYDGPIERRTQ